jgi:hypothetical protein
VLAVRSDGESARALDQSPIGTDSRYAKTNEVDDSSKVAGILSRINVPTGLLLRE